MMLPDCTTARPHIRPPSRPPRPFGFAVQRSPPVGRVPSHGAASAPARACNRLRFPSTNTARPRSGTGGRLKNWGSPPITATLQVQWPEETREASWSAPALWRFTRAHFRTALAHRLAPQVSSLATSRPALRALSNLRRLTHPGKCVNYDSLPGSLEDALRTPTFRRHRRPICRQ